MLFKQAIVVRFRELCEGVTPSTVYSMLDERRKDISVTTVKKLCDGLEITIIDFFNDDIFKNLEQEIK